jgi:TolA-binding protein
VTNVPAGQAGGAASSEPGAPITLSIEEVKAQLITELEAKFEDRVKGFQRVIGSKDERMQALEKELRQLKTASLTPEELAELSEQEKDQRIAELENKLELQALAGQFPDEMPYFQRLLEATSAEDQLQVFREYRQTLTPKPAEAPEGDPTADDFEVPEVDPNNPRRTSSAGIEMNDEVADRILASFSRKR